MIRVRLTETDVRRIRAHLLSGAYTARAAVLEMPQGAVEREMALVRFEEARDALHRLEAGAGMAPTDIEGLAP